MRTTESKSALSHLNYFELVSFIQENYQPAPFSESFSTHLIDKIDYDPPDGIVYLNMN